MFATVSTASTRPPK